MKSTMGLGVRQSGRKPNRLSVCGGNRCRKAYWFELESLKSVRGDIVNLMLAVKSAELDCGLWTFENWEETTESTESIELMG